MSNSLVNFPTPGDEWRDSGEGGISVALMVPYSHDFEQCIAGNYCRVALFDVIVSGTTTRELFPRYDSNDWENRNPEDFYSIPLSAWIAIGSTKHSLWSDRQERYFSPTMRDLTPAGRALLTSLNILYNNKVRIVTLLDT